MGDALFDAEVVLLGASVPCFELGEAEDGADNQDEDGPLATAVGGGCVGSFGFGWK